MNLIELADAINQAEKDGDMDKAHKLKTQYWIRQMNILVFGKGDLS